LERSGLFQRTGLHGAEFVAAVPEISGLAGAGPGDGGRVGGKPYAFILDEPFRWETWAAPKTPLGAIDHNRALTGDDLRDFVNGKLFPYLHGFRQRASGPNTIEYKIGEIFGEIKNKIQSGYNLREIIDQMDLLRFRSRPKSTNCRTCTKPRFGTWATRGATAANTTRPAR
jgi:hypothetical protein